MGVRVRGKMVIRKVKYSTSSSQLKERLGDTTDERNQRSREHIHQQKSFHFVDQETEKRRKQVNNIQNGVSHQSQVIE
jgi:hypothetical protein